MNQPIISVKNIKKSFPRPEGQNLTVLDNVDLSIFPGEIVALLGRSGSGKSTLLRVMAGLEKPTHGDVLFKNQPVRGPVEGLSMVFQSFALMPWLTVLENVELGLEAKNICSEQRRKKAIDAIDMIGLDGFENAYPKELSGGMRQRVGLARALVVEPQLLVMDEPFSALDILTAETLRKDLMKLWLSDNNSTLQSILLVTHNIEEAALLADRILIFGSNPGYIKASLTVNQSHPRDNEEKIKAVVDDIYYLMTTPLPASHLKLLHEIDFDNIDITYRLPDAEPSQIQALVGEINQLSSHGHVDLPKLIDEVPIDEDEFFSLIEAMQLLHFATVSRGDVVLTQQGRLFAGADLQEAKTIFRNQVLQWIPLIKHIKDDILQTEQEQIKEEVITEILSEKLSNSEAERVLSIAISWSRYAEIFSYDYESGLMNLENPK